MSASYKSSANSSERSARRLGVLFRSPLQALVLLRRHPLSIIGLIISVGFFVVALLAPWMTPYDSFQMNIASRLQPPTLSHPFGTDEYGRDLLSRVILGSQTSIIVATGVVIISASVGTLAGLIGAYKGLFIDEAIMRTADVFLAFPSLILAVIVAATLGPSTFNIIVALAITWWPVYARLVYGETKVIRELPYIDAARLFRLSDARIVLRHILPNCATPVIQRVALDMGFIILTAAALGFMGLGARPPTPEWGLMVSIGRRYFPISWWYVTFPGLAISFVVLGFNLLADGLRDAMDPRLKE